MYSAENGQKNNGHTILTDCVTVLIPVVLPTLLRQLLQDKPFLASKGQIFLSSYIQLFPRFDPPFSISFSPNISPVFSFTGQPFMRLTECNLEIKRSFFLSLFRVISTFKGIKRKEWVNKIKDERNGMTLKLA